MQATRREFCQLIGLMAAGAVTSRRAWGAWTAFADPKTRFAAKPVAGRGFVLGSIDDGGNVLIIPSETGPIVVDAKFSYTAPDLLADIDVLLHAKPALLINTHHHADHSGGNWAFQESAKIVAHKNFNPRLAANLDRYVKGAEARVEELGRSDADQAVIKSANEVLAKLKTFKSANFAAKQELPDGVSVLEKGNVTMHVYHYGNGHTDNDLVVFFQDQNMVHMGDLLFNKVNVFIDRSAKANTVSWQKSLRDALKLCDENTVVIPGHGEVTTKAAISTQIEYFDQMREIVTAAIKDGRSKDTIAAMKPEYFKDYGFANLLPLALTAMYEEISEEAH